MWERAVGGSSLPCLSFSVTPVDGDAVGGSSSPLPSSSVTVVDGPVVGESSSPLLPSSVTMVDGAAVGGSSSSVTRVDGLTVGCISRCHKIVIGKDVFIVRPQPTHAEAVHCFGGCGRSKEC